VEKEIINISDGEEKMQVVRDIVFISDDEEEEEEEEEEHSTSSSTSSENDSNIAREEEEECESLNFRLSESEQEEINTEDESFNLILSSSSSPSPSPSRCPLMYDVPFLEPDFPTNHSMVLLDPTPLSINDPRPFQLENNDIDSLMMATTSIEPFHCHMYAVFYTRPQRVLRCKNTKLTTYLERRHDLFGPLRSPSLSARPDKAKCDRI